MTPDDPKPEDDAPPEPPAESESLSDTEGELQDFMGSDESGGDHLHLAEEPAGDDD